MSPQAVDSSSFKFTEFQVGDSFVRQPGIPFSQQVPPGRQLRLVACRGLQDGRGVAHVELLLSPDVFELEPSVEQEIVQRGLKKVNFFLAMATKLVATI